MFLVSLPILLLQSKIQEFFSLVLIQIMFLELIRNNMIA